MNLKKIFVYCFMLFSLVDFILCILTFIKIQNVFISIYYFFNSVCFLFVSLFWNKNRIIYVLIYSLLLLLNCIFLVYSNNFSNKLNNLIAFIVIDIIMITQRKSGKKDIEI